MSDLGASTEKSAAEGHRPATSVDDRTFIKAFVEIATKYPESPAVEASDGRLTYRALLERARSIAAALQLRGVQRGDRVAVSLSLSREWPAAVLGVWLCAATYVPIDPAHPTDRKRFSLENAGCAVVLTTSSDSALANGVAILAIDTILPVGSNEGIDVLSLNDDDAYVIYTSGSTGRPKGVLVPHRGIALLADAQSHLFGVSLGTRVLQLASISFDASVSELVLTLVAGGTLVMVAQPDTRPIGPLVRTLRELQIDLVTLPPSVLTLLPLDQLPSALSIVVAGETCPPELMRRAAQLHSIFNAYGPTEATVCATVRRCDGKEVSSNIGWPLPYVIVDIADDRGTPVADGSVGEVLIGGPQLAVGYLGTSELTAASFIETPRGRRYRTGDFASRQTDGSIDFLHRGDDQVQIRGQRVELGEVRSVLMRCDEVLDAAVVATADESGQNRLVAYLVTSGSSDVTQMVRSHARLHLTAAMVPAVFVPLAELPLTSSGKLDKDALPAAFRAPKATNDLSSEGRVRAAWKKMLEVEEISPDDDFFDLGGDSLLAAKVAEAVGTDLDVDVEVHALFEHSTLSQFTAHVVEQTRARQERPRRMWEFWKRL